MYYRRIFFLLLIGRFESFVLLWFGNILVCRGTERRHSLSAAELAGELAAWSCRLPALGRATDDPAGHGPVQAGPAFGRGQRQGRPVIGCPKRSSHFLATIRQRQVDRNQEKLHDTYRHGITSS